ncbi:MAG: GMC family oxidoreductase [Pseudomonadota bacterium]
MLKDLGSGGIGEELRTEFCIIGAGVAGQTLAMRLAKAGKAVLLVESGGLEFNPAIQALSDGDVTGEPYYELQSARLRMFGGTAAIWGGRCAELDAIDFEQRDYIPHSGWPISKADLVPFYTRAYEAMDIEDRGAAAPVSGPVSSRAVFDRNKLDVGYWRFDEFGERFTNVSRGNLDTVDILINATMTEMDISDAGAVTSVTVRSLSGHCTRLCARIFVLAAGAIETIRALMAAVPKRKNGLGNSRDLLGRHFMEHPHGRGGEIVSEKLVRSLEAVPRAFRANGHRYAAYVRLSDAEQRRQGVLNSSLSLAPRRHEGSSEELVRALKQKLKHDLPSTRFWRTSYKWLKGMSGRARETVDPWASVWSVKQPGSRLGLYAVIRAEQAPNPESRIMLSARRDALGLPLAALNWQFSEIDKRSTLALMTTLKNEYQRLGLGDVIPARWLEDDAVQWQMDPLISSHPIGGYHHMGGTRMADTPQTGVVDRDCRLFESPNLYIAGSSVFPTGGWANPTLTIIALAERLAEHLCQT